MSKNSPKQRLLQLREWLKSNKTTTNSSEPTKKFSKSDYYKKSR